MNPQGYAAEKIAATFLQHHGLKLLETNYRSRFGEIDLIMLDGKEIVFVEVRLRTNGAFGGAGASITPAKQLKLARTAEDYMMHHGSAPCRFDAILMASMNPEDLEWIRNAFETA